MALVVSESLRSAGFQVTTTLTPDEAWEMVVRDEPHAIVSDLHFGAAEHESGAALLARVDARFPWIGLLLLTSHLSPVLAVGDPSVLPARAVYLVKSRLTGVGALATAVHSAIAGTEPQSDTGDAGRSEG